MIYFDNAATSWPKPPGVAEAMVNFIQHTGANPGRSGHRLSIEASRVVYGAREAVAHLFNAPDPMRVVFGHNITEGLNLALYGLLKPGDHVITSSLEHNSMMRPLRDLEKRGVTLTVVPCSNKRPFDPTKIEAAIRPTTQMIAMNHASNVTGALLPIAEVGEIARKHNLLFLVDTAQTGGAYPVDMQALKIDLLGFTGHKSLLGPMGTGGLIIGKRVNTAVLRPLKRGGTGSRSEEEYQPTFLPDMCESGTPNAVGLAGLFAGLRWLMENKVENIRSHEIMLTQALIDGLLGIPKVTVYGCHLANQQTATVSFNIEGIEPSTVGMRLDEEYEIMCRVGLHCSPAAHKTIGTFPNGTVRFGMSAFNTLEEVQFSLDAIQKISKEAK